jgi:hypothetical protein
MRSIMKLGALVCIACISAICFFADSRDTIGQELNAEKTEILDTISKASIRSICVNDVYLNCLRIDSVQCFREVESAAESCKDLRGAFMPPLPDHDVLSEQEAASFRGFSEEFVKCLIEQHLNYGEFDKQVAERCLGGGR